MLCYSKNKRCIIWGYQLDVVCKQYQAHVLIHQFKSLSHNMILNYDGQSTVNDLERQPGKQTQTSNFVRRRRSNLNALDNTQNEMVPKLLKNMRMSVSIT